MQTKRRAVLIGVGVLFVALLLGAPAIRQAATRGNSTPTPVYVDTRGPLGARLFNPTRQPNLPLEVKPFGKMPGGVLMTDNLEALAELGPLAPIAPHPQLRIADPNGRWLAVAARPLVIVVGSSIKPSVDPPTSLFEAVEPRWKARCGLSPKLFQGFPDIALRRSLGKSGYALFRQRVRQNGVRADLSDMELLSLVETSRLDWALVDSAVLNPSRGRGVVRILPDQDGPFSESSLGAPAVITVVAVLEGDGSAESVEFARSLASFEASAWFQAAGTGQYSLNRQAKRPQDLAPMPRWLTVPKQASGKL